MKPAPFSYHAPSTVEEAVALLAKYAPDDGRVIAGGQSLAPAMAFIPLPLEGTRTGFSGFSRRAGDVAVAMAGVAFRDEPGRIAGARIAVGGAQAAPRRIAEAEAALEGRTPSGVGFSAAAAALDPLEDHSSSASYRRDIARAMVLRALEGAR